MFQEGDSLSQAGWLLSGLKRFLPRLRFQLPTAQQYYQNWLRDHVPHRAVPMPWLVAKALASAAWANGHIDLSVLILLGFAFFLRSMEMITLRAENITVDERSHQIVLTLVETKTSKQFQQSLVLRHGGLVKIIAAARSRLPLDGPIWQYSPHLFRQSFSTLLNHFHLTSFNFSLYSLRRGGATHSYTQSRDLNAVAIQGRWKDLRTARIYLDAPEPLWFACPFLRPSPSPSNQLLFFGVNSGSCAKSITWGDWGWVLGCWLGLLLRQGHFRCLRTGLGVNWLLLGFSMPFGAPQSGAPYGCTVKKRLCWQVE